MSAHLRRRALPGLAAGLLALPARRQRVPGKPYRQHHSIVTLPSEFALICRREEVHLVDLHFVAISR